MSDEDLHATAVAVDGRGCLITGKSGGGKSLLAIEMIALGAILISDDRVVVRAGENLMLDAPSAIAGMIEARGLGILRLPHRPAPCSLWVDLDAEETERLPPSRKRDLLGHGVPVIFGRNRPGLASILTLWLRSGGRCVD